jgi:hypothetical protein
MFDHVDGQQPVEGTVPKWVGKAIEIAEDVGARGAIPVDPDGARLPVNATANVQYSRCSRSGGVGHSSRVSKANSIGRAGLARYLSEAGEYTVESMDTEDFRRIALSLPGAEESSHMGSPDFRVGGRIFATLASQKQGYGNLMLTPEQQAAFVAELSDAFVPIAGGWGRNGATHIRLAAANADVLAGALRTAWKLRLEKNAKPARKTRGKK